MKVFINVILILTTPLILKATEFSLDLSQQEIAQLEGTERHLSLEQLNELRPWAENSQILLKDLLNTIKSLSKAEKESELLGVVKDVVLASAPKNTELLMRYVLNRGVIVYKMLRVETNGSIVGSRNARIRILEQSVHKALHYYQSDLRFLQGGSESVEPIPFAQFGVEYFQFLLELSKSVFDASAQYEMTKMSLEFLQWDLYRDLDQKVYAPQILKINNKLKEIDNALKSSPVTNLSRDQQLIDQIKNMKKLIENLELEKIQGIDAEGLQTKTQYELVPPTQELYDSLSSDYSVRSIKNIFSYERSRKRKEKKKEKRKENCLGEYCVGNVVININVRSVDIDELVLVGAQGKIVGLNSSQRKVAVNWTKDEKGDSKNLTKAHFTKELALASSGSCLDEYCIGGNIIHLDYGWAGKIVGLNSSQRKVAVNWTRDEKGYSKNLTKAHFTKELALASSGSCLDEYCIGDNIIHLDYGWAGKIVGLNSSQRKVAVNWTRDEKGYSKNLTKAHFTKELAL